MTEKPVPPDAVKASIKNAGIIAGLKQMVQGDGVPMKPKDIDLHTLKKKAQEMIEDLQQVIASGKLGDTDLQRLGSLLIKLQSALQGGMISREALAAVMSEAGTAISVADNAAGAKEALNQKMEQLWYRIEQNNKAIDDDFEKMRKEGVRFDEKLWQKHKELSEYCLAHPHDIGKQKELNAIDDQLQLQAELQLDTHLGAKPYFDDAKKKSEERHRLVEHDLTGIEKKTAILSANTDLDWNEDIPSEKFKKVDKYAVQDVTINDITVTNMGQKPKNTEKQVK